MDPRTIDGAENKIIDINGISTHYYEAGAGTPLLLTHGGGAGADAYGTGEVVFRRLQNNFMYLPLT